MTAADLRQRFPLTAAALEEVPGQDPGRAGNGILSHLLDLEARFGHRDQVTISLDRSRRASMARPEFDVALAGGGLSLIYGAALARQGFRVVVFDHRRIGCGHREWNISWDELSPLWRSGLFTRAEVDALVKMRYRTGICRFGAGSAYPVSGVLDCVVDAETLLAELRRRALAAGATLLDYHALAAYSVHSSGVALTLAPRANDDDDRGQRGGKPPPVELTARLLLDGMGAGSPHARFDLCCPTVGGVMSGLSRGDGPLDLDPTVGEILVTTEGVQDGRQHIWEGFPAPGAQDPGATDRMTIYLFHYCEPADLGEHPLLSLYERFFATLPRYKRGALRLCKATYGFIPAYTRLRPMPVSPHPRVLLVGDAASRHSPLTFCGFGAMMRSFWPVTRGIVACLREDRLSSRALSAAFAEPAALRVLGALTLMMTSRRRRDSDDAGEVNHLLDSAFATLQEQGQEVYAAFLRDEIGVSDFVTFMNGTARRHPEIYRRVFRTLSIGEVTTWLGHLAALALSPAPDSEELRYS